MILSSIHATVRALLRPGCALVFAAGLLFSSVAPAAVCGFNSQAELDGRIETLNGRPNCQSRRCSESEARRERRMGQELTLLELCQESGTPDFCGFRTAETAVWYFHALLNELNSIRPPRGRPRGRGPVDNDQLIAEKKAALKSVREFLDTCPKGSVKSGGGGLRSQE